MHGGDGGRAVRGEGSAGGSERTLECGGRAGCSRLGQQRQEARGAWPRGQELGDGWRHAAIGFCRRQGAGARVRASGGAAWAWAGEAAAGPRRSAEAGQRGAARAGALLGRLAGLGRKRGGGPRRRKTLFHLYFQELFKGQLLNIILSKKMTSFENVPKMKVV